MLLEGSQREYQALCLRQAKAQLTADALQRSVDRRFQGCGPGARAFRTRLKRASRLTGATITILQPKLVSDEDGKKHQTMEVVQVRATRLQVVGAAIERARELRRSLEAFHTRTPEARQATTLKPAPAPAVVHVEGRLL